MTMMRITMTRRRKAKHPKPFPVVGVHAPNVNWRTTLMPTTMAELSVASEQ